MFLWIIGRLNQPLYWLSLALINAATAGLVDWKAKRRSLREQYARNIHEAEVKAAAISAADEVKAALLEAALHNAREMMTIKTLVNGERTVLLGLYAAAMEAIAAEHNNPLAVAAAKAAREMLEQHTRQQAIAKGILDENVDAGVSHHKNGMDI